MKSDVIIIGGGASGLVAAIVSARLGKKVTILEHKDRIGKKILATGNGRCNYTNSYQSKECYRGEDSSFAWKVLSFFGVSDTITFFEELGIYPKIKNGYYYPNSEQASSVLEVLRYELEHLKVNILCDINILDVNKKKDEFVVTTNQNKYIGNQLILATGGCASPDLGSDGSGFALAKEFGHKIIKPIPALVQLKAKGNYFKALQGVRVDSKISLYIDNEYTAFEQGELQLTNYGVSGIPIFQLSRFASRALDLNKTVKLSIDFMPELKDNEVFELILKRCEMGDYKNVEELFTGLFNKKLAYVLIKEANIDVTTLVKNLNKKQIGILVQRIKQFNIEVLEPNPFNNAQVSAGGVATIDIDPKTLESKLVKNLYIIGELLDVDGTCGGYNLQWAWTTGYLAGSATSGE